MSSETDKLISKNEDPPILSSQEFYDLFYKNQFRKFLYRSFFFFQFVCLGIGIYFFKKVDQDSSEAAKGILACQIISAVLIFLHLLIYIAVCIYRKMKLNKDPFERERDTIFSLEYGSFIFALIVSLFCFLGIAYSIYSTKVDTEKFLRTSLAAIGGFVITNVAPWVISLISAYALSYIFKKTSG